MFVHHERERTVHVHVGQANRLPRNNGFLITILSPYANKMHAGSSEVLVSTDGGRYDVNMAARQRIPVYWDGLASAIRRCSWFYRGNNDIMQPYNEEKSKLLEVGELLAVFYRCF